MRTGYDTAPPRSCHTAASTCHMPAAAMPAYMLQGTLIGPFSRSCCMPRGQPATLAGAVKKSNAAAAAVCGDTIRPVRAALGIIAHTIPYGNRDKAYAACGALSQVRTACVTVQEYSVQCSCHVLCQCRAPKCPSNLFATLSQGGCHRDIIPFKLKVWSLVASPGRQFKREAAS